MPAVIQSAPQRSIQRPPGSARIKVLFVITDLRLGGAEVLLHETLRHLDRGRFEASLCLTLAGGELTEKVRALGVEVHELHTADVLYDLRAVWRLRSLIRFLRPDIVHAHLLTADLAARLATAFRGGPIMVSTFHNHYYWQRGGNLRRRLKARWHRWSAQHLCDACIAVSPALRSIYREELGYRKEPFFALRNFVDPEVFRPASAPRRAALRAARGIGLHERVFLNVGNLSEQKGQERLVRLFAELPRGERCNRLVIIGDGPRRAALERCIDDLGARDRIALLGTRTDVGEWLQAVDVFLLPSYWEGQSIALLEAMATGLVVLATAVGGIPDALEGGRCGLLVPARDDEALRCSIEELASAAELPTELGQRARARVCSRHSGRAVISELERIYTELAGRRR